MADETRTVIIDVEVEDKDFDKEIGAINTELKENQANIKELSKDYAANATEIAKLQAKNRDLSKSKQSLIKESKLEAGSLDALRAKLANQTKERNGLNTSTEEGAARFAELQDSIGDLNEEISGFEEAGGDFRRNVGNYPSLADNAKGAISGLWKTIAANPLILIAGALAGLVKLFSESQAGAEFFRKTSAALNTTLGFLSDIVEKLGVFLIDTFSNPQQALEDFGNLVKENIINRFEGMLELIPQLAKAVTLLFEGEFREAADVATDAVAKVTLGVENITDKMSAAVTATVDFFNAVAEGTETAFLLEQQLIANEKAIANQAVLQAKSIKDQKELNLLIEDQNASFEDRITAAEKFQAVEAKQIAASIALQKERIRLLKEQNEITNSTEEDIQRVRDAEIELANLQAASFEREVTNQNKLNTVRNQQRAEQLAADKAALKEQEDAEKAFAKAIADIAKEQDKVDEQFKKDAEDREKELSDLRTELGEKGLSEFTGFVKKGSAVGRTAALISIAQDTAEAIAALTAASEGNPANFFTFGLAGVAQFAAGLTRIGINIAKAKSIIGASGGSLGGGAGGVTSGGDAANRRRIGLESQAASLATAEGRERSEAGRQNALAVQDAVNGLNLQVAVTDINTAQDSRNAKVNESSLA